MSTETPLDDDPEMVTVAKTTRGTPTDTYHTRDCTNYPKRPRDIPLAEAERRGLEECDVCAGGTPTGKPERDYDQLVDDLRKEMGVETVE